MKTAFSKIFTPPPLFNVMSGGVGGQISFTPVSSNVAAGPVGTPGGNPMFTPSGEGVRFNTEHKKYKLTWWEPESIFKYNSILMSAFYGIKWWDFREHFRIPRKDFLFVADSGGFQQLTSENRIEPINVLKWQENNADIGMTLDVPPKDIPFAIREKGPYKSFKDRAEQTARNTNIMVRNRTKEKDFMLYTVVHGSDREQVQYWYDQMKEHDFDGYCGSPYPFNDPMRPALHMAFAHSRGFKRIHILLGTGDNVTPINVYGSNLFDLFTFDSSSYAVGSKFRKYRLPYSKESIMFGRKDHTKITQLPCDCPICNISTPEVFLSEGSVPGALISLHNLYNYIRLIKLLKSLSKDEEFFFEYAKRIYPDRTLDALNFLRLYKETDFDTAYEKYKVSHFGKKRTLTGLLG